MNRIIIEIRTIYEFKFVIEFIDMEILYICSIPSMSSMSVQMRLQQL